MKKTIVKAFTLALVAGLVVPAFADAAPGKKKRDKRQYDPSYGKGNHYDSRAYDRRSYGRNSHGRDSYGRNNYSQRGHSGRYGSNDYNYYDSKGHFRVPKTLGHDHGRYYQPFYYGSMYYAPHSHSHAIYSFPVATAYGPSYRPYAYCESSFYAGGYFGPRGPSFSFSFRF